MTTGVVSHLKTCRATLLGSDLRSFVNKIPHYLRRMHLMHGLDERAPRPLQIHHFERSSRSCLLPTLPVGVGAGGVVATRVLIQWASAAAIAMGRQGNRPLGVALVPLLAALAGQALDPVVQLAARCREEGEVDAKQKY